MIGGTSDRLECLLGIGHTLAMASQFLFIVLLVAFLLFFRLFLTTGLKPVRLKRDCNNTAFIPRSLTLHTVNTKESVISLAGGYLSRHTPLRSMKFGHNATRYANFSIVELTDLYKGNQ